MTYWLQKSFLWYPCHWIWIFSLKCVWLCVVCLRLPCWQREIIMISAHQCLIISQNVPHCCKIFTPYVWSNKDQSTHHHSQYTYSHTWIVIFVHSHRSTTIYSSADRWRSGKERESWKQSQHFESNLRISRQQFPVDLLVTKPVDCKRKHLFSLLFAL